MVALAGLGAFTGWLVKWALEREAKNTDSWRDAALGGTETAEKATEVALTQARKRVRWDRGIAKLEDEDDA